MMKLLVVIASGLAAVSIGVSAQADVIAGWDFSAYENPGDLAGGGSSPGPSNAFYDSNGAGAAAATLGSLTIGGAGTFLPTAGAGQNLQNGTATQGYRPRGPVESNVSEPYAGSGKTAFESFGILKDEGQGATNHFAMLAKGSVTLDFEASAPGGADTWAVSFGAKTQGGGGTDGGELACGGSCSTTFDVSLDTGSGLQACSSGGTLEVDGVAASFPITVTPQDQRFRVTCPNSGVNTDTPVVRISMSGSDSTGNPLIDNVAIEAELVPEPTTALGLVAGVGALLGLARRRR